MNESDLFAFHKKETFSSLLESSINNTKNVDKYEVADVKEEDED